MYLPSLHTNNHGFTFIELLVALVSISIIALTVSQFVSTSFRTNATLINETETLVAVNNIFANISNTARYGTNFTTSDNGKILNFTTPNFNASGNEVRASISLTGNKIYLNQDDGVINILNNSKELIEDLSFTIPNPYNVIVDLTIAGKNYQTTIRGLNCRPNN